MDCRYVEEHLTDYLDRSLPAGALEEIAEHFDDCPACAALAEDVRAVLVECKTLPALDPGLALVEKILLRTSGRPRTRTLRELLQDYVVRPVLTPRFAMGSALTVLFLVFAVYWMSPRVSGVASALSPRELFRSMDRAVQGIYGEGLKAYDKKNEWQAQFSFIKNNVFNRLGLMMEQMDVPVEGNGKSGKPGQQQPKAPSEKSSILLLPA
ncbi:MAG: hypothetical protein DMG07_00100 [Acidobacteria bacterium]|nr:MAG: hypothetical protein DMG07_00100 [Acidobacteriota bacterium]